MSGEVPRRVGANQLLRTVADSCAAALEGSPRRQPWVAVLAIGAAKRRKEILFGSNSAAPDGTFGDGAFFPTTHDVGYPSSATPWLMACAPIAKT